MDWRQLAACRGMATELFYPERGEVLGEAKMVCTRCPVRAACLADGLFEKFGVWGGMSERERRRERPRRREVAA